MSSFFKKYARYFYLIIATVIVLWVFYTWRQLFLPFIVGLALAYIMLPLVRWVERSLPGKSRRWVKAKRIVAIIIVALTVLTVIGVAIFFAVNRFANDSSGMIENASQFIDKALSNVQEWLSSMGAGLSESWQERLDDTAANLGNIVDDALEGLLANSGGMISSSFGVVMSFAALPLFLFYLLKDAEKIKRGIFGSLSPNVACHAQRIFGIIERTLGRYLRAQLILGMVVGLMTLIGLLFIAPGVAIPLAMVNGLFEMIPTFGPIIGGVIMAIVVLAVAPDKVIWAIFLAVLVQLLENNFLVPRIQAATMRLHPAAVLFLIVAGSYLWGFWGLVFIVPIVSTLIDVFKYVHALGSPAVVAETPPAEDTS
ncbi:MAG: AI-2E family transporter [Dehalococcoidia bacterium]|nr:AI-2E family transporter [Dehalococcoidia bacterium]